MSARILVVEDDVALARVLRDNLIFQGFDVEWAADGDSAIAAVRTRTPDLILLDIMLPGRTGFELFGLLHHDNRASVIILSARSQKADKLLGLSLGADDYVTKPFDLEELLARVHAVLRRNRNVVDQVVMGAVTVDFRTRTARSGRRPVHLTHLEFELLRYLAARPGQVIPRDELLREVWKYPEIPSTTRSVDLTIARLRKKIEPDPTNPAFIHTIHGGGYCLTPSGRHRDS